MVGQTEKQTVRALITMLSLGGIKKLIKCESDTKNLNQSRKKFRNLLTKLALYLYFYYTLLQ